LNRRTATSSSWSYDDTGAVKESALPPPRGDGSPRYREGSPRSVSSALPALASEPRLAQGLSAREIGGDWREIGGSRSGFENESCRRRRETDSVV
jgi:hypothetical protein